MFPDRWPGAALLLLRVAAAIPLMFGGTPELRGVAHWWLHGAQFVAIGVGILLLAGLWTAIAGALEAIIEIWIISGQRDDPSVHYLLAALAVSLVMLGLGHGPSTPGCLAGSESIFEDAWAPHEPRQ
jgi:hypothetical protein